MQLGDLTPNPKNPRKITDSKLKMLKKSLAEFGDLSGFVFNVRSKKLVSGHQRMKVLPPVSEIVIEKRYEHPTKLGTTAEGYILVNGEQLKYREVDWDEQKEIAGNIAANKHGGDWETEGLTEWLSQLNDLDYDLEFTGFDQDEFKSLMGEVEEGDEEGADIPEVDQFIVTTYCDNEFDMQKLYEKLTDEGYSCKLIR